MGATETIAFTGAENIVRSWAQKPMHWSTHKAVNRNNGKWKSHRGIEYKWVDEL